MMGNTSVSCNVSDTLPLDWKYVSEGGATMVFSYAGPPNRKFDGMVLRLRKCPIGLHIPGEDEFTTQEEPDDPMIEFQQKCMSLLISQDHLPRLESVNLDQVWLEVFSDTHNQLRPKNRREKDCIDVTRRKGVLATDLIGGEGLAVEIKPKWAFLPSTSHLSVETCLIKRQTCRFCMHSRMRASLGESVALGYCPLDLFSGDENRIRNAVESLWDSWQMSGGTVNNLRVFMNGRLVKPDSISLLTEELSGEPQNIRDVFTLKMLPLLTDTPVLDTLARLQRTLDALDIEGLATLWKRTLGSSAGVILETSATTPLGSGSADHSMDPSIHEWRQFIETYVSHHTPDGHFSASNMSHDDPNPENLRYYLLAYLLSATFKDCSIILRPSQDIRAPGTITVIDLDIKGMDRLSKWEKLDREIVETYSSIPYEERKVCLDAGKI